MFDYIQELVKTGTPKQLYYFIRNNWYSLTEEQQEFIQNHQEINNIILYYLGYFDVYDVYDESV